MFKVIKRKILYVLLCSTSLVSNAIAADTNAAIVQSTSIETIVVTAPRAETAARQVQQDSATLVNVQSAESIEKYPDYNAAEAMGRIPSVSLSTDTGEGRFVNIRGIDANLNGATYGGISLLNTFPAGTAASGGGRAVEFDTIPTGAIDGIVLYKTLSPDRSAEGLGGQIELTPRSGKNVSKPFVNLDLGVGYENLHDHAGPFTAAITAGTNFGFSGGKLLLGNEEPQSGAAGNNSNSTPFTIILTASRKDDRRAVDDIEPSYANDGATAVDNVLGEVDFRRYDYHRRRFGYGSALEFAPNLNHKYYIRADVAGYIESVHKNHFYAVFDGNPNATASGFVSDTFQPRTFVDDSQETHRNTIITAGGSDNFDNLQIDYYVGYSRATYVENYYRESLWYGPKGLYGTYNQGNPDHILFNFYQNAALTLPFNSVDASQYSKPRLRQYFESDADEEYSYALNAKYPLSVIGQNGSIKVGIESRLRNKGVTDLGAQTKPTANLASYASNNIGIASGYYNGWYPVAPYVPAGSLNSLFTSPLTPSLGRDFKDGENVYAAYAMYTFDLGNLSFLSGARIESTYARYGNYLTRTDVNGNSSVNFVTNKNSYTNVFPTVQVKYKLDDDQQIRASYSTGIARPGFTQAGGNAGVDFTTSPRPVFTTGNPNLKPTTGDNFDLDFEYYLPDGGILQLGAFDKEFSNYIFKHTRINVSDPVFLGQNGDIATFANESGRATGLELAFHQKFTWLPSFLSNLGTDANVTYVDSRFLEYDSTVSGTGKNQYGSLPGTSHVTWNLALFYETERLALRLSTEYVGHSLFGLNGDKSLDTIQDDKLNMDFASSYVITDNFTAYANVKNLLDTPLRYYEGSVNRPIQLEYYGQTYETGLRLNF